MEKKGKKGTVLIGGLFSNGSVFELCKKPVEDNPYTPPRGKKKTV